MTLGTAPDGQRLSLGRYLLFAALCCGGCALDLVSKSWIFDRLGMPGSQPPWWLIPGAFCLETSLNEGALFGVGQGQVWLFSALSIVAALAILGWLFVAGAAESWLLTFALSLICGGILGNLYDRMGWPGLKWNLAHNGHAPGDPVYAVRDWLHVQVDSIGFDFAVFNLADSLLVCGVGLFILHTFRTGPATGGAASSLPTPSGEATRSAS